ncbi:MAG TPA: hypothetical protein VGI16_11720 [Candidatus Acidoferrum sp.]|jgi:hypothetical protein
MDNSKFLEACQAAKEAVSSIQDATYRPVAYGVALRAILAESPTAFTTNSLSASTPPGNVPKEVKSDTKRRILELKGEGYFSDPKLPKEVHSELRVRGFHHNPSDVRMALLRLAQDKTLRRLSENGNRFRYAQL